MVHYQSQATRLVCGCRCGSNNSAMFADIVPEHLRSTVYAFDRSFEGAVAACAAPLVGELCSLPCSLSVCRSLCVCLSLPLSACLALVFFLSGDRCTKGDCMRTLFPFLYKSKISKVCLLPLTVWLCVCLSGCLSLSLFVCLSASLLSVCLSVGLSVCLFLLLPAPLSVCLSVCVCVCSPLSVSLWPSGCLSRCLSVCWPHPRLLLSCSLPVGGAQAPQQPPIYCCRVLGRIPLPCAISLLGSLYIRHSWCGSSQRHSEECWQWSKPPIDLHITIGLLHAKQLIVLYGV